MKAIVINQYGGEEVLELDDMPIPEIGADEVLVKNYATSVNPVDWKVRKGDAKLLTGFKFPRVLGGDVAGTVAQLGENVRRFQPGDRVFALKPALKEGGAYAEYVAIKARYLVHIPQELSFEEAAAVPLAGLTAYQGLVHDGNITANQQVLINGSSGGVGVFAVQIAKAFNTEVTGVCSGRNVELTRSLGADQVIDYTQEDVLALRQQFDLIYDTVGNLSFKSGRHLLKPHGVWVTTQPMPVNFLYSALTLLGRQSYKVVTTKPGSRDMLQLKMLIEQGTVRPIIDRTYALDEIAEAHRYSEAGHAVGKIVVQVRPEQKEARATTSEATALTD
ncbi:NADPH:quinone reductase [Catalinimonas alkaloidigena]|uniref:NADPH:quinone reductase n=1 Tax=Catalinimonas alkaloidigena TaxID=1075417 RepID=A0A1G8WMR4_9BACT|nr:NAD(P)-dependent alcohol dehydrogenase [Catalinimonas alkaloidigena]SDJ79584.1 NADPH:quinone reductase [Catalinimonas alkaloidigena]